MHLWRAGDQVKVDDYLDTRGLQRNALFNQILQALIELADAGSDERSILEALSNHVAAPRRRSGAETEGASIWRSRSWIDMKSSSVRTILGST